VNDYTEQMIQRHRQSGVLVDTNLLLLYFVGLLRPEQITQFKRTSTFSISDFELLSRLLGEFARVLTTPNILTEVNHQFLAVQLQELPDFPSRYTAINALLLW